jgi:NADH-quinone oxidoreductase subunit E
MSSVDPTLNQEIMNSIVARYPRKRSAIMPLLHYVQSVAGYVTNSGIENIAEILEIATAEVSAVATFYTQYKRNPIGEYHVGVCTNSLCAVMGGDAIFGALKEHLGIENDGVTADGKVSLEHIECNAACDYAPVVMANWETVESAKALVDGARAGNPPAPTRGPNRLVTYKQASAVLAGLDDGLAGEGVQAGPATLLGLGIARAGEKGGK